MTSFRDRRGGAVRLPTRPAWRSVSRQSSPSSAWMAIRQRRGWEDLPSTGNFVLSRPAQRRPPRWPPGCKAARPDPRLNDWLPAGSPAQSVAG